MTTAPIPNIPDDQLRAFALGYYYGRADGWDKDLYSNWPQTEAEALLRHLYRRGYEAGVADYDPNPTAGE